MLRQVFRFCTRKSNLDIVDNYTPTAGCDRMMEITRQAYLSVKDNTKYDRCLNPQRRALLQLDRPAQFRSSQKYAPEDGEPPCGETHPAGEAKNH